MAVPAREAPRLKGQLLLYHVARRCGSPQSAQPERVRATGLSALVLSRDRGGTGPARRSRTERAEVDRGSALGSLRAAARRRARREPARVARGLSPGRLGAALSGTDRRGTRGAWLVSAGVPNLPPQAGPSTVAWCPGTPTRGRSDVTSGASRASARATGGGRGGCPRTRDGRRSMSHDRRAVNDDHPRFRRRMTSAADSFVLMLLRLRIRATSSSVVGRSASSATSARS